MTYTETEVQEYADCLGIEYGTPELDRHAAIQNLLEDRVAWAIGEYAAHMFRSEFVAEETERLVDAWEREL